MAKKFEFSDVTQKIEAHEATKEFDLIDVGLIDRNEKNFYPVETKSVKKLADSITEHGLLQPVVVMKNETTGRYTLIAGERRYSAILLLNWEKIPAKVKRDVSAIDEEIMLIQTNSTARELTNEIKLKQAKRLDELYAEKRTQNDPTLKGKKTAEVLASDLNVSVSTAKRMQRLNKKLIEPFLEAINKTEIPMSIGLDIVKYFDGEAQTQLYEDWKATGAELEELIARKRQETTDEFAIPIIEDAPKSKSTVGSEQLQEEIPDVPIEPKGMELTADDEITAFNSALHTMYNKVAAEQGAVDIDKIDFQTLEMVYALLTSEKEKEKDAQVPGQLGVDEEGNLIAEEPQPAKGQPSRFNTKRSLKSETKA